MQPCLLERVVLEAASEHCGVWLSVRSKKNTLRDQFLFNLYQWFSNCGTWASSGVFLFLKTDIFYVAFSHEFLSGLDMIHSQFTDFSLILVKLNPRK